MADVQTNGTRRDTAPADAPDLAAEVAALKRQVAALTQEVARLKGDVAELPQHRQIVAARQAEQKRLTAAQEEAWRNAERHKAAKEHLDRGFVQETEFAFRHWNLCADGVYVCREVPPSVYNSPLKIGTLDLPRD